DWDLIRQQPLIIVPLGVAVLVALAWRGLLSPRALSAGPNRAIGLGAADLVVGLGLLMALQLVAGLVLRPFVGSLEEAPPRLAVAARGPEPGARAGRGRPRGRPRAAHGAAVGRGAGAAPVRRVA